jgi:hypothetical protein
VWQGLVGFKNQRLPLPTAAPPECPPMFLQIIREVRLRASFRLTPHASPVGACQCFHTDPAKRPRFDAVQRNLLIMVQGAQQQQQLVQRR